jgi:hypothetical protein
VNADRNTDRCGGGADECGAKGEQKSAPKCLATEVLYQKPTCADKRTFSGGDSLSPKMFSCARALGETRFADYSIGETIHTPSAQRPRVLYWDLGGSKKNSYSVRDSGFWSWKLSIKLNRMQFLYIARVPHPVVMKRARHRDHKNNFENSLLVFCVILVYPLLDNQSTMTDAVNIFVFGALTGSFTRSALSSNSRVEAVLALFSLGGLCFNLWIVNQRQNLPVWPLFEDIPTLLAYKWVPVLADIPTLLAYRGNLIQMLLDRRQAFGNIFIALIPFTVVTLGDEAAIVWMNDRKEYTEVIWPPSISKLLVDRGNSLSNTTNGVHHKTLTRIIKPFFAPNCMRNYVTVINQTTQQALEHWCGPRILYSIIFKRYSLRMFLVALFGGVDEDALHQFLGPPEFLGQSFEATMKARDRILDRVDAMVDEFAQKHPAESEKAQNTIIGRMIYATDEKGNTLTSQERRDIILLLLFAGKFLWW